MTDGTIVESFLLLKKYHVKMLVIYFKLKSFKSFFFFFVEMRLCICKLERTVQFFFWHVISFPTFFKASHRPLKLSDLVLHRSSLKSKKIRTFAKGYSAVCLFIFLFVNCVFCLLFLEKAKI